MKQYIIRRTLLLVLILWFTTLLVFFGMRLVPGDVASAMAALAEGGSGGTTSEEDKQKIRESLGLNEPVMVQYGKWIWGMLTMNPGFSLWTGQPILYQLKSMWMVSIELMVLTLLVTWISAVVMGVLSALYQDSPIDYGLRITSIIGLAAPNFWVAILVLMALAIYFNWQPPIKYVPIWEDPMSNLIKFVWPSLVLGWRSAAAMARMVRSTMLEVLREDYIRTAHAKGLKQSSVIARHALKNAALPVVTIMGFQVSGLIAGVVIIEQVFSLPGLGRELRDAIFNRDYTMVQFLVTFSAFATVAMILVVDILYAMIDPRIRYR